MAAHLNSVQEQPYNFIEPTSSEKQIEKERFREERRIKRARAKEEQARIDNEQKKQERKTRQSLK